MGTEDVKVTAMNMYKYKERLRLYKRWHGLLVNDNLREIIINIWRVEIKKTGCRVSIQAYYGIPEQSRNYIHFSH